MNRCAYCDFLSLFASQQSYVVEHPVLQYLLYLCDDPFALHAIQQVFLF